jgi:hypothetical protein
LSEPDVAAGSGGECLERADVASEKDREVAVPGLGGDPVEVDAGREGCGAVAGAQEVGGDAFGGEASVAARARSIRAMALPDSARRLTLA